MSQFERTIVVVDHDADRATAISSELDLRGYHVLRRSSGVDALQCVLEFHPDFVLSDELLDLERPELLHSIHEASPTTRVLFVARKTDDSWLPGEERVRILVDDGQEIAQVIDRLLKK